MPAKKTLERARQAEHEGKAPSTQAGEFVREEIEHIREGKHDASSNKQAIAIGLSKARRAGVKLRPPKKGTVSEETRRKAEREYELAQGGNTHRRRLSVPALRLKLSSAGAGMPFRKSRSQSRRNRSLGAEVTLTNRWREKLPVRVPETVGSELS